MHSVDLTRLLDELTTELAEAEQRAQEAVRRVEYLRGQRDGVLAVIRLAQQPAVITEGEG